MEATVFFPQMLVTICQTAQLHMQDDRNLSFIRYFVSELFTAFVGGNSVCKVEVLCIFLI
jgi:hypothetical protein